MPKIRKDLQLNILLLFFVIFFSLLIAEIILRLFFPIPSYSYKPYTFQLDSELGYRLTPNLDYVLKQPEFTITIKTNSYGLRDSEYSLDDINKKDFVILGLGDSMTFGYGVNINETFLALIEKHFIEKGINMKIINAGVGGYGTAQELKTAERYLPIFNPDLVLLTYFIGNDIRDNYNFFNGGNWSLIDGDLVEGAKNKLSILNRLNKFSNKLFIVRYMRRVIYGNPSVINLINRLNKGNKLDIDTEQFTINYSDDMQKKWLVTKNELYNLNEYCKKNGVPLIIVVIPSKLQIDKKLQDETIKSYEIKSDNFDFRKINKLIDEFGNQYNITTIDVTSLVSSESSKYYFKMDGHINKVGHKLVADFVFVEISDKIKNGKK